MHDYRILNTEGHKAYKQNTFCNLVINLFILQNVTLDVRILL